MAGKLAEYVRMDVTKEIAEKPETPSSPRMDRSRRALWTITLIAAAMVAVLAFGAYRQPELLLNLMGLRYCG
ncbi:MAG: hypothetical protein Q7J42_17040 [Sulfuritalea sp.]|nr:hypothetical protein [Sulfuritalea sp.]